MARKKKPAEAPVPPTREATEDREEGAESFTDLQQECEDLRGQALRAKADYANLKRRGLADLDASIVRRIQPFVEEMLQILDYLDMALAAPATSEESKALAIGIQMTRDRLVDALGREGIETVPIEGAFDPTLHEASSTSPSEDVEPGHVIAAVRPGYTWRGAVLRHAHVIVAEDPGAEPVSEPTTDPVPEDQDGGEDA